MLRNESVKSRLERSSLLLYILEVFTPLNHRCRELQKLLVVASQ